MKLINPSSGFPLFNFGDKRIAFGGSGGVPLSVPSGLGYTPPFTVYKSGTTYTTDIDMEDYVVSVDEEYYLSPDGDDGNNGLTPETPKKSISTLVDTLNASPPSVGATLYLESGEYLNSDSLDCRSLNFPCNIICESGKAILALTQSVTWSKEGGFTNLYRSSSVTSNTGCVIDKSDPDSFGIAKRLLSRTPNSVVDATPGSMNTGSSSVIIHTFDSRVPDDDIVVMSRVGPVYTQTSANDTYFKNVEFWGGGNPVIIDYTGTANTVFDNCHLLYSGSSAGGNGLEATAGDTVIFYQSAAQYNTDDGFGYRDSIRAIEIECRGAWNGFNESAANTNGSSAHISTTSVRVNGLYQFNNDRNLHDVNSTKNWLVGCKAGDAQNGSSDVYESANFVFGISGGSSQCLAWLEGCESLGGSAGDLGAYSDSIVRIKDCVGFDVQTEGDTAEIIDGY